VRVEGFYSKSDVALILGVSARQVQNYVNDNRLRRVLDGNRSWIPKSDVDNMYAGKRQAGSAKLGDLKPIEERLRSLEESVEILKAGLGFAAPKSNRSEAELLMIRQRVLDDLARTGWSSARMSAVADDLATLSEKDVATLCALKGVTAWVPLFDLCKRMLVNIENHPSYPENGLDSLHSRMERARDRVYGLITSATKVRSGVPTAKALDMYELLRMKPGAVDTFIATYVAGCAE
jgi:predicted transcriptional regulator